MTLCVLVCLVKFYMFIMDKFDVRGPTLVYKNIRVEKVREKVPSDQLRVLEEGPILVAKTAQASPIYGGNRHPVGYSMPRRLKELVRT